MKFINMRLKESNYYRSVHYINVCHVERILTLLKPAEIEMPMREKGLNFTVLQMFVKTKRYTENECFKLIGYARIIFKLYNWQVF